MLPLWPLSDSRSFDLANERVTADAPSPSPRTDSSMHAAVLVPQLFNLNLLQLVPRSMKEFFVEAKVIETQPDKISLFVPKGIFHIKH